MSTVYEDIMQGLEQAIDHEKFKQLIDVTGAELKPGDPERCQGNGKHPDYECCCDECDHYLTCFPEWEKGQNND